MSGYSRVLVAFSLLLSFNLSAQKGKGQPPLFYYANRIENEHAIASFISKIKLPEKGAWLKVLHLGDSHVKSGFFAEAFVEELNAFLIQKQKSDSLALIPFIDLNVMARNGATVKSFLQEVYSAEAVSDYAPDLIIISFGTNEATNKMPVDTLSVYYSRLLKQLQTDAPGASFLISTPGDCHRKVRTTVYRKGRAVSVTRYERNAEVLQVRQFIKLFASTNQLAVWDWHTVMGGANAMIRWVGHGYAKEDRVHLTAEGYRLQGRLLAQAFIKMINSIQTTTFHDFY